MGEGIEAGGYGMDSGNALAVILLPVAKVFLAWRQQRITGEGKKQQRDAPMKCTSKN